MIDLSKKIKEKIIFFFDFFYFFFELFLKSKEKSTSFLIKNQSSQIQKNKNSLFKKFKKGKPADKNSSGLGLYISKRIILQPL